MSVDAETAKAAVRETYGQVARSGGSCCGGGETISLQSSALGYRGADVAAVAEGADLGLGCGAPLEFADLQPGETVLDLGSGAGFDAFIARRTVGDAGRVYGVDMTPDMVARARANAARLGYDNVEFRLGEIEHLPIADGSIDLVISNCVLNLVPDKPAAFAEIARVLKPGGRFCISDIVATAELPEALLASMAAYAGCISGAVREADYLAGLAAAGLREIEVVKRVEALELLTGASCCGDESELAALRPGMVASITARGRR